MPTAQQITQRLAIHFSARTVRSTAAAPARPSVNVSAGFEEAAYVESGVPGTQPVTATM
jgi:hypothetical protein